MSEEIYENDILAVECISHCLDRQRHSKRGYYVCSVCYNQYLYNRPKMERTCPVCGHVMPICNSVNDGEVEMIRSYAGSFLYEESDEHFKYLINALRNTRKKAEAERQKRQEKLASEFLSKSLNLSRDELLEDIRDFYPEYTIKNLADAVWEWVGIYSGGAEVYDKETGRSEYVGISS